MKTRISVLLAVLLLLSMLSPVSAAAVESPSIYGPYDNFEELYEAYMQAVEDGDTNQQAYLLEIGRTSLRAEIEMSQANTPAPAYDAVEQYWREEVLPQYFSYSYFETRDNGVCLSLGNRLSYWSSDDKSTGWTAVRISYQNHAYWDNTDIMEEQFYCHARLGYAAIESEWNLEPWKTSINSITCN